MKTVVPSREVCHLWAHAAQDHARNRSRSVFFNYEVLYSYGAHFPIGLRLKRKDREGFIYLLTEDNYSTTTSKHQAYARQAVPGENHYVPRLSNGSSSETINLENVAQIVKRRARESLAEALKMRKSFERYNKALDARRWYTSIEKAAEATGQKRKIARILGSITKDYDAAMQGYEEYERKMRENRKIRRAQDADRRARRAEMRREENKKYEAEALASLPAWRAGAGPLARGFALPHTVLRWNSETDEIQSSAGVTFPADHARKLFPLWISLVVHGRGYKRNGHTIHLGPYALDEITETGDIKAGCHNIPRQEVAHIARVLGLMPVPSATLVEKDSSA
jgi:hypothetical protein